MGSLSRFWDIPLLLMLSIIWASAFAMIKVAVPVVGPFFLVVCRCSIGALLMLAVVLLSRSARWPDTGRDWFWLVITGVISTAVPFLLISFAEQRITSSMTAMLMTVGPMVAIVLGHIATDDEKIDNGKLIGVGIGFLGAVYLLREGMQGLGGVGILYPLAVVLAATCYAIGGLMAKRLPTVSAEVIAAVVLLASALVMVPLMVLTGTTPDFTTITVEAWGALIWLGLMPSGIAFYLRYFLIKRTGYGFVSYVGYLIPVFAIVIGAVWLREAVMLDTVACMAVIILGLFLTRGAGDFPWNLAPALVAWRSRLN